MEKRIVFLLGAGAALDWHNAPTTNVITQRLIKGGFKNKKGKTVTSVIYEWLLNKSEGKGDINFETIINVIEDFIHYWSLDDSTQIHGLSYFIGRDSEKWEDFINFKRVSERQIEIPDRDESINSRGYIGDAPSPEAKYFELLLMEVLDAISSYISDYSFCTHKHYQELEKVENKEINDLASSYFKAIKNHHLRVYNLNYDRLIQYLFFRSEIQAFQGFTTMNLFPRLDESPTLDPLRILTDRETNCIYHLHGNVNWEVLSENENQLPTYTFKLSYGPNFAFNDGFAEIAIEKGKRMLVGSIITGFQKVQRTSLSPFRQMASSFDHDCLTGDELIVIGYSFGDEHINDVIRNARKHNTKLKIKIIDPAFDDKGFLFGFLHHWGYMVPGIFRNEGRDKIIIDQFGVEIYKISFKEYLRRAGRVMPSKA
jgi:hypothetical protein